MVLRVGYLLWQVKFSESKWAELNVFVSGTLLLGWCFDPIPDPCVSKYIFYKSCWLFTIKGYAGFSHYISVLNSTYLEWSWKLIFHVGMLFCSFWLPERNPIIVFLTFIEESGITGRLYSLLAHLPASKHCIIHTC